MLSSAFPPPLVCPKQKNVCLQEGDIVDGSREGSVSQCSSPSLSFAISNCFIGGRSLEKDKKTCTRVGTVATSKVAL